nr:hypothetical protein SHINE37_42582 [Rhizobiaceae bacterium]
MRLESLAYRPFIVFTPEKIIEINTQGLGNAPENRNAALLLAGFDLGKIGRADADGLRQVLACHAAEIAPDADRALSVDQPVDEFGRNLEIVALRDAPFGFVVGGDVLQHFRHLDERLVFGPREHDHLFAARRGKSGHLVHRPLPSVDASAAIDFKHIKNVAICIEDHTPVTDPQSKARTSLQLFDICFLRCRIGSILVNLPSDLVGFVSRYPGQRP